MTYITGMLPVLGVLCCLLGMSFGIAFDFINMMQLLHLVPLMRLYLPTAITNMFSWFQYYNFKGWLFGIWDFSQMIEEDEFQINGVPLTYNFRKMGFLTNSFFLNFAEVILFIIYIALLVPIFSSLSMFFPRVKLFKNFDRNLQDGFIISLCNLTFVRLFLACLMNFGQFSVVSKPDRIGSLGSYFYLVFVLVFILFIYL